MYHIGLIYILYLIKLRWLISWSNGFHTISAKFLWFDFWFMSSSESEKYHGLQNRHIFILLALEMHGVMNLESLVYYVKFFHNKTSLFLSLVFFYIIFEIKNL